MASKIQKIKAKIHRILEVPTSEEVLSFQARFILPIGGVARGQPANGFHWPRTWAWLKLWIRQSVSLAIRKPLGDMSASLTYTFTLSVVPLLAIGFSFFKLFGGLKSLLNNTIQPLLDNAFPEDVSAQLLSFLDALIGKLDTSTLTAVSFVTFLGTVVALLRNIERCLNDIFDEKMSRSLFRQLTNYWFFVSFTPLLIAFSVLKSTEVTKNLVWLTANLEQWGLAGVFPFLRWTASQFIQVAFFGVLFAVISSKKVSFKAVFASAILTNVMFECLQGLNWYLTKRSFSDPTASQIYGSIPLLAVVFFVWIRLIWLTILGGALLCAGWTLLENNLKNQGEHDTLFEDVVLCGLLFEKIVQHFETQGSPISEKKLAKDFESKVENIERSLLWMKKSGLLFAAQTEAASGVDAKQDVVGPTTRGLEASKSSQAFLKALKSPQQAGLLCPDLNRKLAVASPFVSGLVKDI